MKQNEFPSGWDDGRVRRVIDHYDKQTPEQAVAEDEAVFEDQHETVMTVPRELVPAVRELIAKSRKT